MSSNIYNFTEKQPLIEESDNDSVHIEEVSKLAKLAKIKITDQEKRQYAKELAGVVNWFQKLDEIEMQQGDIDQLEVTKVSGSIDDKVGKDHVDVLYSTEVEHGYFIVPKIISDN